MTLNNWVKIYINNINENYFLRVNGISVKKPYKKEFALVWHDHYDLSKRMLNYKRKNSSNI